MHSKVHVGEHAGNRYTNGPQGALDIGHCTNGPQGALDMFDLCFSYGHGFVFSGFACAFFYIHTILCRGLV